MKKNEQVQNLSGEAVELMAHATEHFIRHFSTLASRHNTGKSNTLEYDALAEATQSEESLNFLRMMVRLPPFRTSNNAPRSPRSFDRVA